MKKRTICFLLAFGTLSVAAGIDDQSLIPVERLEAPKHAPILLVTGGKPSFAIVGRFAAESAVRGPEGQPLKQFGRDAVRQAADLLSEAFLKCCGVRVAILDEADPQVSRYGAVIALGRTTWSEKLGIEPKTLPREGFVVKTFDGGIAIVGNDWVDGDYDVFNWRTRRLTCNGTLWGAQDFAEKVLGVRYFSPCDKGLWTDFPKLNRVVVSDFTSTDHPQYWFRAGYPNDGWRTATSGDCFGGEAPHPFDLAKAHPDYEISFSPYLNTCDLPEGLTFPAKNAECSLCTMPGLALLKDEGVRAHEEKLMRDWAAATGRPVRSWDYICWPAEFCSAPYVFGKVAQDHYRRLRPYTVGSFINGTGTPPEKRLFLSAYVWVRSMWNPEFDLNALYDTFAARMFAAGAKPMREIIRMQEDGWMRPWGAGQISNKNIYEISYPRKDVLRMQELFAEAKALAKGDALALRRIAKYEACFTDFFRESEDLANGTALEPTLIQKVASDPAVDGRIAEP